MIERIKLKQLVIESLHQRSLVWLVGVRRVGKTTLCKSLPNAKYFDCELPSVRDRLEDPEMFWRQHLNQLVVLDEVHRLTDPSNVLKIATDHFPSIKVVATGSSTLAARRKFRDTLTGRKKDILMQPFFLDEVADMPTFDLDQRLLRGGLPPALLSDQLDDGFYGEWMDSFWAKDVLELFAIDKKTSFLKLAELILRQSGEVFSSSSFAGPCQISRQTVTNYLEALSTALFAIVVRPYSNKRANDIIAAPKVYGFDTGFVCFVRGWEKLRPEDRGNLIEHLVLSELLFKFGKEKVFYWRDKQKHEVDFVLKPSRGKFVHAIECESSYKNFSGRNLKAFRRAYPEGQNFLYAANVNERMTLKFSGMAVEVLPLQCPLQL